ncbi:MAG: hypothetical protein R3300_10640, partial [Candidatus Promineifilaceae bacterium]|nr:hypothetical protein [Candidatus Promineifilaceae bacterium]
MLEDTAKRTTRNVLTTIGIIVAIVLIYALAIQQTEIELVKPLDPVRQESVLRVLRLLADPDVFEVQEATGNLALSEAAQITIERIIETILMALIASTVGTVLAVPASFLAARNLMEDITSPLAAIMAGVVAIPVGGYIGWLFSSTLNGWVETVANLSAGTYISLGVVAGTVPAVWAVNRFSPPLVSVEKRPRGVELRALLAVLASLILALIGLLMLAQLGLTAGAYL